MGKKNDTNKDVLKENNLTYDDYATLDEQKRYELVQGHLEFMGPSPSTIHQLLLSEIYEQLSSNCKSDFFIFFAPIDVILSSTNVRQPDIVLINRKRIDILTNRGIEGIPDLVIEIVSPSTIKRDKIDKLKTYAHFTIPEYWIVDPNSSTVEQYVLSENHYEIINIFQGNERITSPTIPCISFTMETIMQNIPDILG